MPERTRCDRCKRRIPKEVVWDYELSHIWQLGIRLYRLGGQLCPKCGHDLQELIALFLKSEPDARRKMSAKRTQLTVDTLIIERAMFRAGLEKQQLARKCGVAPSAISRLLDGTHKNILLILKVCDVLKLKYERVVKAVADGSSQTDASEAVQEVDTANAI